MSELKDGVLTIKGGPGEVNLQIPVCMISDYFATVAVEYLARKGVVARFDIRPKPHPTEFSIGPAESVQHPGGHS